MKDLQQLAKNFLSEVSSDDSWINAESTFVLSRLTRLLTEVRDEAMHDSTVNWDEPGFNPFCRND